MQYINNNKGSSILRTALCQINPTVGDLAGNTNKIIGDIEKNKKIGADIIVFPELSITGYPPEDLLLKSSFISDNLSCLKNIAKNCKDIIAIVGFVNRSDKNIFNSAAVICNKKIVGIYDKICLPNYGVFDEKRYFTPGKTIPVFKIGKFTPLEKRSSLAGLTFGISICEDILEEKGPAYKLAKAGVDLIIVLNASPYYVEKWKKRERVAKSFTKNKKSRVAYLNIVGGQDELVFDGHSFVLNKKGSPIARGAQFEEDTIVFDTELKGSKSGLKSNKGIKVINLPSISKKLKTQIKKEIKHPVPKTEEIYAALCLGLKDYARKNGFKKVVLGLSGGIDSALVAAIAVDSLGSENVKSIFMPSQYTAERSRDDAMQLAKNLGIEYTEISIENIFSCFLKELAPYFEKYPANIAEENLQARIRGNLLMAFSNKFGYLVLTTGNKSEMSMGYSTLYGDMAGGLSVIKDVPKTLVYELSKYRNNISKVIPDSIIEREPTAELKPDQKDRDCLPPYDILDKIIHGYVENDKSMEEIMRLGIDKETAAKAIKMIDKNEYKRRQSAPGIKITPKAFGKDRRMPITNKYGL